MAETQDVRLKILFVSSEVTPFSKTGGLADVAQGLPVALNKRGVDIRAVTPKYKCVHIEGDRAELNHCVPVYFIEEDRYFMRDGLYGTKDGDYTDNLDRFVFFSRRTIEILKEIGFKPDVIHCNDWQTALVPLYLKEEAQRDSFYGGIKTVFTIHNLGYQGLFPKDEFEKTGLPLKYFSIDGVEFYGKIGLLKAGIIFSDCVTTVSPTYAKEIQTRELGYGLNGVLSKRRKSIFGILNGIDYDEWNPSCDKELKFNFSASNISGKYKNKASLQIEAGLEENPKAPLIGVVSRLVDQKGFDLISRVIKPLLKTQVQVILLGVGEEKYHIFFDKIKKRFPHKASINLKFDPVLAKKIYAGSDIFLMPSNYEPCGLGQIISLRYGTIPVVRKTGGLADTINEYDPKAKDGNGFVFEKYNADEFLAAINRALLLYKNEDDWNSLVVRAMKYDYSWEKSADKYIEVYEKIIA